VIIDQPVTQVVPLGGNATFSVTVSATTVNPRFQWRLNGGNLPGKTSSFLSISNIQVADAGLYSVVVYNDFGATNSRGAELRINNVPFVPFSDSFSAAPFLTAPTGVVQSVNFDATAETGEPPHNGRPAKRSVWANWIAPSAVEGIVKFRVAGTFDTVLAVYTGGLTGGLTEVGSDDDSGDFLGSRVSFRTQRQMVYHIAIDGVGGAEGIFLLEWDFEPTQESLPIFGLEPFDQTVIAGADAMFRVTGGSNYTWQWFFNGQPLLSQTQPTLVVKDAGPNNVGEYFCRAFEGNRFRDTRKVRLQVNMNDLGGADPFSRTTEKFFDVRQSANDDAAKSNAKTVAHGYSGSQIFSTIGSTKEIGEPNHCGIAGGASEWFAYQAEANGRLFIDTDGSNFDTVLAVYTGPGDSFATLVSVDCDNDSGLDGKDSRVDFAATSGTIYWIAVDGVNSPITGQPAKGSVSLHFHLVLPLTLSAMTYTNTAGGRMSFKVTGTPNLPATIQAAMNPDGGPWTSLITNSTATGQFNYTNSGLGLMPYRFYRAVNKF
jgi:hypothetical protein